MTSDPHEHARPKHWWRHRKPREDVNPDQLVLLDEREAPHPAGDDRNEGGRHSGRASRSPNSPSTYNEFPEGF